MKNKPLVSICIGIYNREKYLEECLKSIIGQSYENIEILVSDNASIDNSYYIAEALLSKSNRKYKLFKQMENKGPDFNYQFLSKVAKGDYVALFHSDDIYHKNIIKKTVEFFAENKSDEVAIVMSLSNILKKKGGYSIYSYRQTLKNLLLKRTNPFNCPTAVWKKNIVLSFDFENRYPEANDLLGYMKILRQKKNIVVINEELHFYRIHEGQDNAIQNAKFKFSDSGIYKVSRDFIKQDKIVSLYPLLFISFIYEKLRYLKRFLRK